MSKWLASRTKLMPAILPANRLVGMEDALSVPFVNGCVIVPTMPRLESVPLVVTVSMADDWAEECDEAALPANLAMRDFLRSTDAADFLVEISIVNMRSRDAGLRLMTGVGGKKCLGSAVSDGFAASRLLRTNMWDTACTVFKKRQPEFFVAAPCADCLAIYREEQEAREFLASPALAETPGQVSLHPFILTRDGVAGMREEEVSA